MLCLTRLPLIDISDKLVVLGFCLLVSLVQHVLFTFFVYLSLLGDIVLRKHVPIPFIINFEAFLNEPKDLLFAVEFALLALGDTHTTKERFVICNFLPKEFNLLELTLCKILLTRALAQGRHGESASNRVICKLPPLSGFSCSTGVSGRAVLDNFLSLVFIPLPDALGEFVSFSQILLAFTRASLGFVLWELFVRIIGGRRSIFFFVAFPALSRLLLLVTLPLSRIRFPFPGMSLSITPVSPRTFRVVLVQFRDTARSRVIVDDERKLLLAQRLGIFLCSLASGIVGMRLLVPAGGLPVDFAYERMSSGGIW
ncbi:hypothetical protein B0F90DRAFT_1241526 [Multifurca ochricompacta]|uniref:Uncharacterized protein n=1 Tax=Multifurca ochricompacta TaxID=376703 RepID=A0AAD4M6Y0_9AGAM|nr:hypothetical protein B0F90DRAFT_1241526 [Multifurca ochricompacta]